MYNKTTNTTNNLRGRSWLMLLLFASMMPRGAWAQTELTLYDGGDNSSAIRGANGGERNVTLSGRTLYRDGNWNTLCLPFNMTASQIAASQLADATIKELDDTDSKLENGTLTLKFKDASTTVGNETYTIVAGKPYIVKWPVALTINNATDWETFVSNVAMDEQYAGKIVKLAADISIVSNDIVGTSTDKPFKGTFDGGGHTINCTITNTSGVGTAPFMNINNATIMNLKVTGTVTGGNHCAGLVGYAYGTNTIKNCEVDVYVDCQATGTETHCGGILGNGTTSTTTISNCLFSGSITGSTSTTGIIYGWGEAGGTQTIDHCLANAEHTYANSLDMIKGDGTKSASYCYKNTGSGDYGTEVDVNFGTDKSATSTYVTNLGATNWELVEYVEDETTKYKVVPKMTAYVDKTSPISDPVFSGVTITNTTPTEVSFTNNENETNKCVFKGNYDPLTIDSNNRNEVLLLTSGNKLGYASSDRTLNAFRAYFQIPTTSGGQAVRSFVLNFGDSEETGIISLTADPSPKGEGTGYTYDLQGRKVTNPAKGLYIVNGKKVFIK